MKLLVLVLCLALGSCLPCLASAQASSSFAPWPRTGHDSGLSYAAFYDVPVFAYYSPSPLPLAVIPGECFIPATDIYVCMTAPNIISIYNRLSQTTRQIFVPYAEINLLGSAGSADEQSSSDWNPLRVYFYSSEPEQHYVIGAYELTNGTRLWSAHVQDVMSLACNSYVDAMHVTFLASNGRPQLAIYDAFTGKRVWLMQTGDLELILPSPPGGNILVANRNASTFSLLSGGDGHTLWNSAVPAGTSQIALAHYILIEDRGLSNNTVYCVSADSGVLLWNATEAIAKLACSLLPPFAAIVLENTTQTQRWAAVLACQAPSSSGPTHLLVLDAESGRLLAHQTVNGTVTALATIYANVYFAAGSSLYKWNVESLQVQRLWTGGPISAIMIDTDGSFVVSPNVGGNLTLIAPHLHL